MKIMYALTNVVITDISLKKFSSAYNVDLLA